MRNNPSIKYCIKVIYGKPVAYLVDTEQALAFRRLTGRKTVSRSDMLAITELTNVTFTPVFDPALVEAL